MSPAVTEITVAAILEETGVTSLLGMVMLMLLRPEGPGGVFELLDQQRYEFDEIWPVMNF
jgi:hypothetical protein